MKAALLCNGWPRHLEEAGRCLEDLGLRPSLIILPKATAERWHAGNGAAPLAVLSLPGDELRSGNLSKGSVRTLRRARITHLLAFRNDGAAFDLDVAKRVAVTALIEELLVMNGSDAPLRFDRVELLRTARRAVFRRSDPPQPSRPLELFDPVCGRQLPAGGDFSGVDAKGSLVLTKLGYLHIPGMPALDSLEPASGRRLVMLGGSALYGLGLTNNGSTIPASVYRSLRAAEQHWEVLGFGVPGISARGESAALLYRLRHARPDVVVSFSGWNDFNTLFAMELVNGPGAEVLNWTFYDYHHYLRIHAPDEIDDTAIAFAEKKRVKASLAQLDSAAFPGSAAALRQRTWLDNQALMALLCAEMGVRFICALQPHSLLQPALDLQFTRDWVNSHYDFAFTSQNIEPNFLFSSYSKQISKAYEVYRNGLRDLQARYSRAQFVDLSNALSGEERPCFLDGPHLNAYGASRIGEIIAAHVAET